MSFDYIPPKYNPAGDAKLREQKRQDELETETRNKQIPVFMFQGFAFRPQYQVFRGNLYLEGPLCPRQDTKGEECYSALTIESGSKEAVCRVCGFTGILPKPLEEFREIAHLKYQGWQRYIESGGNVQTLDVPYEAIKEQGKDETRGIKIKWSQKDGRNMAIIYFIDRKDNPEGKKAHVFVDFDREELRHDAIDESPANIIALIKAEFPNTSVEVEYKDKK